jgi:hypothetical protein
VGTAVKKVIGFSFGVWFVRVVESEVGGRKGSAKRFHTEIASKGKRNSIVLPANSGARIALTVPWM